MAFQRVTCRCVGRGSNSRLGLQISAIPYRWSETRKFTDIEMRSQLKKLKDTSLIDVVFYILLVALITIFEFTQRTQTRLGHDLINYILPALAPGRGLGFPYLDYYMNRPPGAFVVLKIWEIFFGSQIYSWVLFEYILLLAIGLIINRVCRYFTSKSTSVVLSLLFETQLLFSGTLQMFLPLELVGIFFILLGVLILINNHRKNINIVFSVSVFTLASSVREQYLCVLFIGVIAIAIIQDSWVLRLRSLLVSTIGIAVVLIPMTMMLLNHRSFFAFLHIIWHEYQTEKYAPISYVSWFNKTIEFHTSSSHNYLGFKSSLHKFLFAIGALTFVSSLFSALFAPGKKPQVSNFFVIAIGFSLILSVAWQSAGHRFSSHYAISSLIGIFLCVLIVMYQIGNTIKLKPVISKHGYIYKIIFILLLSPSIQSIHLIGNSIKTINPKLFLENVVLNRSAPLDVNESQSIQILSQSPKNFRCTISVYGWATGQYFFYTNSRPCSRYYIPNLVVSQWMTSEYRQELILNPPRLINYGCLDYRTCSDLDVSEFESVVFPYTALIRECYLSVDNHQNINPVGNNADPGLYVSLYASAAEQSLCISKLVRDVHVE